MAQIAASTGSQNDWRGRQRTNQGGSAFISVLDKNRRNALTDRSAEQLSAVESVSEVLQPSEFAQLGLANPNKNREPPHVVQTTSPGFSFDNKLSGAVVVNAGGYQGSHGHDPWPDYMHGMFVAAGTEFRLGGPGCLSSATST